MRLPVNQMLPLAALALLAGCSGGGGGDQANSGPLPPAGNGPAADYPVKVGDPFTIDGTTYTPVDKLNFDTVGYAALGSEGGDGVTIAHKTLPLPSYAEVTSLDSGKTILVRVERRGPMTNDRMVELSPGAAAHLGITDQARAPIRIRRVNPPEVERAMLRGGARAPARMDTPPSLLTVLKRKLDPALVPVPVPTPTASATPAPRATPSPRATPGPRPTPTPRPTATPTPRLSLSGSPAVAQAGSYLVQVGAFGNRANAAAAAAKIGGQQRASGALTRVIIGPFSSRAAAEAALAKVRGAGYRDARIQRAD